MNAYTFKKIVHGTKRALDKDIERHLNAGIWAVVRTEKIPRGAASKLFTFVAYLKRVKSPD